MPNLVTSSSWEDIKSQIDIVSKDCIAVSRVLTKKALRIKKRKKFIRGINITIGGIAFIVAVIIPSSFHDDVIKIFTALASIALFVDGLIPTLIEEDPPERLSDYAYYIRNYANRLNEAMLEETSDSSRKAKILILLNLADQNLSHVKVLWSWIEDEILKSN